MLIHKGEKYEITSSGETASKSDGTTVRTMKFYPERDLYSISGEIDQLTAWRIFHDISREAMKVKAPISPDHILIDGDGFKISEWSESTDPRFIAPERYSPVWALGASVFFAFLGCHVFQGLGGKGETATSPIPTLRRELPELSGLIARCLAYNPESRPSLQEIAEISKENMARCKSILSQYPPQKAIITDTIKQDEIELLWPDEI